MPYCGCILIPLRSAIGSWSLVVGWLVHNKGSWALEVSLQKDKWNWNGHVHAQGLCMYMHKACACTCTTLHAHFTLTQLGSWRWQQTNIVWCLIALRTSMVPPSCYDLSRLVGGVPNTMVPSKQPENGVKTTLLPLLGCLHWGPYVDPDQQWDARSHIIWISTYEFVWKMYTNVYNIQIGMY
jgi:hypothetical protein